MLLHRCLRLCWLLPMLLLLFVGCQGAVAEVPTPLPAPATATPLVVATATLAPPPTPLPLATAVATLVPLPTVPPTATPLALTLVNEPEPLFEQLTALYGVPLELLTAVNSGVWHYPDNSFVHPVALVRTGDVAFAVDGGRVLQLDLGNATPPAVLLAPGDSVDGVVVQEPLDLALAESGLLVLDRVGDVYHWSWQTAVWQLDRYDRPARPDSSSHYLVALDAAANGRFLLETNYKYALRYNENEESLWTLPPAQRNIDMAVVGDAVYILAQSDDGATAQLVRYRGGQLDRSFRVYVPVEKPRQVVATETAVYLLDQAGRRLWQLDAANGQQQAVWQLLASDPIAALAVDQASQQLLLAGRNRLYFVGEPARWLAVPGDALPVATPLPHDPHWLASLPPLLMPIGGSNITARDLQLPGAPRHYRLGIHAGLDFYWQTGTAVRAVADGTVIRATHDYQPPLLAQFAAWHSEAQTLTYTSPEALDFFRGRQLWLAHDNGLVSRYVHLASLDPTLTAGARVVRGQPLGTVGNSGSPASQYSQTEDAHLHFELWLGEGYVGQYLRPVEVREWFAWLLQND